MGVSSGSLPIGKGRSYRQSGKGLGGCARQGQHGPARQIDEGHEARDRIARHTHEWDATDRVHGDGPPRLDRDPPESKLSSVLNAGPDVVSFPCGNATGSENEIVPGCRPPQGVGSSARMFRSPTSHPSRRSIAASMKRFESKSCEGPRADPGDTISSPVEKTATRTDRRTSSSVRPIAAQTATS